MNSIETLERHLEPSDSHYSACGAPSNVRYTVTIEHDGAEVVVVRELEAPVWRDAYRVLRDIFPLREGFTFTVIAVEV